MSPGGFKCERTLGISMCGAAKPPLRRGFAYGMAKRSYGAAAPPARRPVERLPPVRPFHRPHFKYRFEPPLLAQKFPVWHESPPCGEARGRPGIFFAAGRDLLCRGSQPADSPAGVLPRIRPPCAVWNGSGSGESRFPFYWSGARQVRGGFLLRPFSVRPVFTPWTARDREPHLAVSTKRRGPLWLKWKNCVSAGKRVDFSAQK